MTELIAKHGGYKKLKSFQSAEIISDLTQDFVKRYVDPKSRTRDQMEQAARSGKQNIAEGAQASGASKQTELKLVGVARASLEELLLDYEDFLRQRGLRQWGKDDGRALAIRQLAYGADRTDAGNRTDRTDRTNRTDWSDTTHPSYTTYKSFLSNAEAAANCLICLVHQANYLLDRQLVALEKDLKVKGDFKERYQAARKQQLLGGGENFDEFLKSQGLRRLENGQVVSIKKDKNDEGKQKTAQ
ncbi:MAG: four helix bundle suffix domain-containing protein [Patescibacteria group bacterium]|nr:four helix bundle suffix domain-containing protein [Patescibacteria group bacterium]